ncbi:MAG: phage tail protein [Cyanobacteria bacterium CRU_2_1]|nr:phage tail protein [Cyanobacteria bacterium RU_5_0]NJR57841.1 phage tail protein [Cyanobacteria bacterium CRU_2_1]
MVLPGINAVYTATGLRFDPYRNFNFFVEIQGVLSGGFSECTGLQVETEIQDYQEGGVNEYVHHFAGHTKHPPLVLKHGLTPIDGLWAWHQDNVESGRVKRRNGTIYLLNKSKEPLIWWNFKNAFPSKWTGPELQAASGDVAFESVELVHQGLSRPRLLTLITGLAAGRNS